MERRRTTAKARITVRYMAACGVLAGIAGAAAAAARQPDAPVPTVQFAGVVGELGPAPSLYRDVAGGRAPTPREAHQADDEVAPGRAEARASAAAPAAASDAEVSTLALWLAGLGSMLFVAWRLKGD